MCAAQSTRLPGSTEEVLRNLCVNQQASPQLQAAKSAAGCTNCTAQGCTALQPIYAAAIVHHLQSMYWLMCYWLQLDLHQAPRAKWIIDSTRMHRFQSHSRVPAKQVLHTTQPCRAIQPKQSQAIPGS
jgi:hypothetical protein